MKIELPRDRIEEFCRKWKIREFTPFGSVLREDFRPDSDVDVLVTFEPDAKHSLFDRVEMEEEISGYWAARWTSSRESSSRIRSSATTS
ncbi:MAG TPA: nucleotidyltransferase domain-containing protein [Longimicrobium sp.]|jgi:hypothetical protein